MVTTPHAGPHPLGLRDLISEQVSDWLIARVGPHGQLTAESRKIRPGDAFLARAGQTSKAEDHIAAAIESGAAAIAIEGDATLAAPIVESGRVPTIRVPLLGQRLGMIASEFYGRPSMALQLIAVTGTNGKSTVTAAMAYALARSGISAAAVGTLGLGLFPAGCPKDFEPTWEEQWTGGLTTPDAVSLHRLLASVKQRHVKAVVIEASSIGLVQGRLQGCAIKIAAFTNLSHDHLDIHGSMQAYAQAKALLFSAPSLATAVINTDDHYAELMWRQVDLRVDRIAIGAHIPEHSSAALTAEQVTPTSQGFSIRLHGMGKAEALTGDVQLPVYGRHNVDNAALVAGCLFAMKLSPEEIRERLAEFKLPAGRLQMIRSPNGPWACVDYAHSPDALARVLEALRPLAESRSGRLICLFGCGGDRDSAKRPLMGEIAARLADQVVLTSDNPRSESPEAILEDIFKGVPENYRAKVRCEADRGRAIAETIASARRHDLVLIAGKGHEQRQIIGAESFAFSDVDHAKQALDSWQQMVEGVAHA